jgi:subtilisin-like proprotein convertase family protein
MRNKLTLLFVFSLFLFLQTSAQITVTGGMTATQLANILAGSNIVVSNATLTGAAVASGTFNATNQNIGMNTGVILSTGNISTAPGPNTAGNTSNQLGTNGTSQMDSIAGTATHDAIILEFDFTVQSEFIQFDYIFASEEYPEYAPPNTSTFNDVFAFFISGPGIVGQQNIALIPNTSNPVAINNINAVTNNQYYISNTGGQALSFDAYTTVLTARKDGLTPCMTYHLKLVIADAGDSKYNSAVLLEENSLVQGTVDVTTNTINADNIALEGCVQASFTFSLDQPSTVDKTINFQIAGTATNGVDYLPIAPSLTIPAGQTQAQVFINAISDGFPEGQESILLIYKPEICSGYDTAFLYINDAQPITYTLTPTHLSCYDNHSGQILVSPSGGFPPYHFEVTDSLGIINNYTSNPITGLDAGTYSLMVYDTYGCKAKAIVIGGLFNAGTTFLPDGSGAVYTSTLNISGFNPGATLNSLSMLQNICLNMEHSYMGDLELHLLAPGGQDLLLKSPYGGGSTDLGEPIATGPVDGSASSTLIDPGVGYDYCFNQTPMYGTMVSEANLHYRNYTDAQGHNYSDYYLPAGTYTPEGNLNTLIGTPLNGNWTVRVTDHMYLDNGYIFNWSISFVGDLPDSIVTLHQPAPVTFNHFVTNATCGDANGGINISVNGNYPPFAYLWSNTATTEDIFNVAAGSYTVTVTDDEGCSASEGFSVSNNGTLAMTANITPITCSGAGSGAINISPSGGLPPYTFHWSNGSNTEDISGLTEGNYSVTVTDANTCQMVRLFNITSNPAIQIIQQGLQNEQCGTHNGSISVSAAGGSGSYGYHWSNGISGALNENLNAGTYTVTVTDAYGCTASQSYTLVNDVSNCQIFCYLDVTANLITDESCANGNGAIDVTVSNATPPYVAHWSNGAVTEDLSGLHQGNYTITVTDANQCQKIRTFTVTNNTGTLSISNYNVLNETCGTGNGSIDISVTGGTLPYSYNWSNAQHTQDITDLSAFQYTVTITDANNCKLIQTYQLSNNAGNLQVNGTVNDEICSADNGSIIQTVTGGFGAISYLWSNNSTAQSLQNIAAGNYTCNISDAGGCNQVMQYSVHNLPGNLSISHIQVTNEICNNGAGSVALTVSGSNPVYHWNNSATSGTITGLHDGTYSCTVTNSSGCMITTGPVYVFDAAGTLSVTAAQINDEVCGNGYGNININVSGGNDPYTYLWSNGHTEQDIYNLHAGTYSVTVTDSNGCTYPYQAVIANQPGTLVIQNAVITNESCGNANGAINLMLTGSTTPYTYLWSNGATSQDLSGIHAGTYEVSVTSAQGCTATHTAVVSNTANGMELSWIVTNEICSNHSGSIDLNVSGGAAPYTYTWNDGIHTQDRSGLSAGIYVCTVTDNSSCKSITDTIVVSNFAGSLSVSAVKTNETCGNHQGGINLTVSGGIAPITYQWSNAAITEDLSGLAAGNYSYTVTDANGCTVSGMHTIVNTSSTLAYTVQISDEHCNNNQGAINLTVSGGSSPYTYLWNGGITTEDRSNLNSGNYSCTITDASGCSISTGVLTVSDNPGTLAISSSVVTDEVCDNNHGKIDISISGGNTPYTYHWSTAATTQDIINLSSGTYLVTVTDNAGCSVLGQAVVGNSNGSFGITSHTITDEHCDNHSGAVDILVQGGSTPYTYVWSNGPVTQDISNLSAGSYSVYVTDNAGCSSNATYVVNNSGSAFTITNAVLTHEVCGSAEGGINITHSGGTAPFLYHWSNGANTEDVNHLSAGQYSITVTDAFGCTAYGTYTINNNPGSMIISAGTIDENCGNAQGSIDLYVFGGGLPYEYLWNTGATSQDLSGLHGGSYQVTVTDVFGCSGNYAANIINNTGGFTASIDTIIAESCGNSNGSVYLNVSGGVAPYHINWNTGDTTQNITGLHAGSYNVEITDHAGCSYFLNAVVPNATGTYAITFSNVQDEHCDNGDGFIDIQVTGGTTPYTYHWSNSATSQDITDISQGTYSVTITDAASCHIVQSYHVNNANATNIQLHGNVTDASCSSHNGSIDLCVSGGMAPMIYSWNTGNTSQDLSNLAAGIYHVVVSDDAGCSNSGSFTVLQITNPALGLAYINITNDYCGSGYGSIYFDGTGGSSYSYYLNGTQVFSPYVDYLFAGTYTIAVEDENGCLTDSTVIVGNDVTFTVSHNLINESCNQHNGSIDLSASVTGLTYSWSNGATTEDLSGLDEGTYTCTITDGSCYDYVTLAIQDIFDFSVTANILGDFCGDSTGSIDQTVTGGSGMQYHWSNGSLSEDLMDLIAGNYDCTITNTGSGCAMVQHYTVSSITSGVTLNSIVTPDTCDQSLGSIMNSVNGGSGNYTYEWSQGSSNLSLTGVSAGHYTFTVTDNNDGCDLIRPFTVGDINTFTASGSITNASCASCNDGSIDVSLTTLAGVSNTYTYHWSNLASTQDIVSLLPGTYCVTITASSGCDTVLCFNVPYESGIATNAGKLIKALLYPNPAADEAFLDIDPGPNSSAKFRITTMDGKLVQEGDIPCAGIYKINTSLLPPAVYRVEVYNTENHLEKKLVIMR